MMSWVKSKYFLSVLFAISSIAFAILLSQTVFAAGFLTNVIVEPSNNLFSLESHYVIGFTTATTGTIKTVTMTFPNGFIIGNATTIMVGGIGPGSISVSGQTLTYTVNNAASVLAGTAIIIDIGKIVNSAVTSNTVTVTTKDASNLVIDGPTSSTAFTLKPVSTAMLGANSVTGPKIADGTISKSDIQSGSGIVTGSQSCVGKVVTGFDASGNAVCKTVEFVPNQINTVVSSGNVGDYTSIAIGTDGFPVISYKDITNADLWLVHCTNKSCSAHDFPTILDTTGEVGSYTSIAIGTDGFPVISYYDVTNGDLKLVHCTNVSCVAHNTPTTVDSTGIVGSDTSIAIGTDGFPLISYYDFTNHDLRLVHCTNVSCGTSFSLAVDSTGDVGQYTSITIGTDGFPVISYYDVTNHDLKIVHCISAICKTHDTPATLDSTGDVGQYTSITIGTDGFPVISYYDYTNHNLKFVHCTNVSCKTHSTLAVLDNSPYVGSDSSIAIGTDGFPVISYYDGTNGDLKLVHCTNFSCGTSFTATVDSTGDVGTNTSIAIGTDGFPVISFSDSTNIDLKVAQIGGNILS